MSVEAFDIGAEPGRVLNRDISRGMAVDAENDAFIARRHDQRIRDEDERFEEAAFVEVTRREEYRRREENRLAWCEYHQTQAARHRAVLEFLIARHEAEAARLRRHAWGGGVHS